MLQEREIHIGLTDLNWKKRPGYALRIVLTYILLTLGAFVFLLPFFWLLSTSLKTQAEVYVFPPNFFPSTFRWQNFPEAWTYEGMMFGRWLFNSVLIAGIVMFGSLVSATLCGYGFARLNFPGRDLWFMLVLASIMLPGPVTLIPLYVGYHKIGWLNSIKPLTIPAFFGGGAFNIFLMRQFFKTIPSELEEAAIMDGASRLRILWQILVPLSLPAMATVAVFTFQGVWNDFYSPLIYLTSSEKYTVALGINMFKGLYATMIPYMMAMSWLMVIPMVVVFFLAQRLMIRGVILTGIKA